MSNLTNQPESQKQRWLKYGGNVVIASVVVVALAVLLVYLAQSSHQRIDVTSGAQLSLKPQTKQIVKDVKQNVRLISLYTAPSTADATARSGTESDADRRARAELAAERQMKFDAVRDLLQEYARTTDKIRAEQIDPLAEPSKVDQLVAELTDKYGGAVARYREFIDKYTKTTFPQIQKLAGEETSAISRVELPTDSPDEQLQVIEAAKFTVAGFPSALATINKLIKKPLEEKPPDYKGATDAINSGTEQFDGYLGQIISAFQDAQKNEKLPAPIKAYITESLPRYEALKKLTTEVLTEIKNLGELKLDTLRQSLRARDSILVLGDTDLKVLTAEQVWQADVDRSATTGTGAQLIKPKFAGEQQITSAILSLTEKPKKVAFVRPAGGPLADPGIPGFRRGGPFSSIADRLRSYNFEVIEKDLSGMSAMQAQMQGQPPPPEPTDEELKDAIWIVFNFPAGQGPMGMPSPTIAPKILEHLNNGGSALILNAPQADTLSEALGDWGVSVAPNELIVHEQTTSDDTRSDDFVEEAKKQSYIFVYNDYGDSPITRPINGLDGVLVPLLPVRTETKPGVTATPILPVPQTPRAWAESEPQGIFPPDSKPPTFDPNSDKTGPLFAGAMLERQGKGRLVVLGSLEFAASNIVDMEDQNLRTRGVIAARFPANAELVTNSIFWLAKMEPMIAISPAAMEVSRIGPIPPGTLKFWRVGVLLVGLPALVVLLGVGVYLSRRD
jgi:hypothetical protein